MAGGGGAPTQSAAAAPAQGQGVMPAAISSLVASGYGKGINNVAGAVGGLPAQQAQDTYQPQFSPAVQQAAQQQMVYQQQQNPYFSQMQPRYTPQQQGLQLLLGNMMSRYQMPQGLPQQAPVQQAMPQYRSPALMYRPNPQIAQQKLSKVKPSVFKTQLDEARARIAELEAAEAARAQPSYDPWANAG